MSKENSRLVGTQVSRNPPPTAEVQFLKGTGRPGRAAGNSGLAAV